MTPQQFHDAYRSTAAQVSQGTGIDPIVLLAQWANETAWGTAWSGAPYNLGNIRNGPGGSIITYPTLGDFAAACIATWHNGYYQAVLSATTAAAQLAAICASPWSSGHYGGDLSSFFNPLEAFEMDPLEHAWTGNTSERLRCFLTGQHSFPEVQADGGVIQVPITAQDLMNAIKAIPAAGGSIDLTPVLAAIADLKAHPTVASDPVVLGKLTAIEANLNAPRPAA